MVEYPDALRYSCLTDIAYGSVHEAVSLPRQRGQPTPLCDNRPDPDHLENDIFHSVPELNSVHNTVGCVVHSHTRILDPDSLV